MEKAFLFCMLALARCVIPIGEYVMIVSAENPDYGLTMEDEVVRLKNTGIDRHKPGDSNLFELYVRNNAYVIQHLRRFLYRKSGVGEIMGEHFKENDRGFEFDIVNTDKGLLVKVDNLCLTAGEYDDTYEGYVVEATPCAHKKTQRFMIKRVPLMVKDNRSPMSSIIEFDRGRKLVGIRCV